MNNIGNQGMRISDVSADGVYMTRIDHTGIIIDSTGSRGIEISRTHSSGITINSAGTYGIFISSTVDDGIYLYDIGDNGIRISNTNNDAVYIDNVDGSGISIFAVSDDGLQIDSTGNSGILLHDIGNTISDDGIKMNQIKGDGIDMRDVGNHGIYMRDIANDGIYMFNVGDDGIVILKPHDNGVVIAADSTTMRGLHIYDHSDAGDPDTGIAIKEIGDIGIYMDMPPFASTGLKIKQGVDLTYSVWRGAVEISTNSFREGLIVEAKSTGAYGIVIDTAGYCGIYIKNSGNDGIYIYDTGDDGIYINYPSDDGVDVRSPGDNCFECNGSGVSMFRVTASCEVFGHSFNHYIVEDGEGYSAPIPAATKRWLEHIGEAQTSGGICKVNLPEEFVNSTTINAKYPMQIFITPYGDMSNFWVERGSNYFIVHSQRDAKFAYRVVAVIKGFEQSSIEPVNLNELIEEEPEPPKKSD